MGKLKETLKLASCGLLLSGLLLGGGCHADLDDAAGQAGELDDPVRRLHALGNLERLYGRALTEGKSDLKSAPVKAFQDATWEQLVKTYLEHPEDTQSGGKIQHLFNEMNDPRTFPALIKALGWRTEVNEQHAISAARTLAALDIDGGQRTEAAKKLAEALDRVSGKRPVDNRMRIEFLNALGTLGDPAALEVLINVATRQSEEQNFLINNLAVEKLGALADPGAVDALIKALFLFDPNNPAQRLNSTAPAALVQIGKPSLAPLLKVLAGDHPEAEAIATQLIEAIRDRAPEAAATMTAKGEMAIEASNALGTMGYAAAIAPLIEATKSEDQRVALGAVVAIAQINRTDADTAKIRQAMNAVYQAQPKPQRMQVLRAVQHMYDGGSQGWLLGIAKKRDEELPDIQIIAMNSYALLANKAEAAKAQAAINADSGPYKVTFEKQNNALIAAANECDEDLSCWAKKLAGKDEEVARKAAYMLGRLGRGNATAIDALVGQLDHKKEMVRGDVLSALDFAAVNGSKSGADKIDEIKKKEEGRAIWNHIKPRALATQSKLRQRAK